MTRLSEIEDQWERGHFAAHDFEWLIERVKKLEAVLLAGKALRKEIAKTVDVNFDWSEGAVSTVG